MSKREVMRRIIRGDQAYMIARKENPIKTKSLFPAPVPKESQWEIVGLWCQGVEVKRLAEKTGRSQNAIRWVLEKHLGVGRKSA